MDISFAITKMLAFIRRFYFLTHFGTHKWVWSAVQLPPDFSEEKNPSYSPASYYLLKHHLT